MGGAVAALGSIAVALLAQDLAVGPDQQRSRTDDRRRRARGERRRKTGVDSRRSLFGRHAVSSVRAYPARSSAAPDPAARDVGAGAQLTGGGGQALTCERNERRPAAAARSLHWRGSARGDQAGAGAGAGWRRQRTSESPRLELRGVTKRFPGVLANDNVNLIVRPGEIHALLGENGAGKSTLVKMIYGILQPDSGEILWDGAPVRDRQPARRAQARHRHGVPAFLAVRGADGAGEHRARARRQDPAEAARSRDPARCSISTG